MLYVSSVTQLFGLSGNHFFPWQKAPRGPGPPHYQGFTNTPQSVGLLWTSDQPDAETSTVRQSDN